MVRLRERTVAVKTSEIIKEVDRWIIGNKRPDLANFGVTIARPRNHTHCGPEVSHVLIIAVDPPKGRKIGAKLGLTTLDFDVVKAVDTLMTGLAMKVR